MTGTLATAGPALRLPRWVVLRDLLRQHWPALLGGGVTLLMAVMLAAGLLGTGIDGLTRAVPANPMFYIAFALFYLAPPMFDFWIFRRLWRLPRDGMVAVHKKRIANESLVGYLGEAWFYAWARQRGDVAHAPFAAVKDVSILSAVAGNFATLAAIALLLPLAGDLLGPAQTRTLWISVIVMVAATLPFLLFRERVFSLPAAALRWIFGMHAGRVVITALLLALAWHFALPGIAGTTLLALTAVRLLVSRLPLVPNKELLFANFAVILAADDETLSAVVAFTGALTLLAHAGLIAAFGISGLARRKHEPQDATLRSAAARALPGAVDRAG